MLKGKHVVQLIATLPSPSPLFSQVLLFEHYADNLTRFPTPNREQLRSLMFQLLMGVKELHFKRYIHMDIREENIFFKRVRHNNSDTLSPISKAIGSVGVIFALGDFGLAVEEDDPPNYECAVLPNNRQPPEALKRNLVKRRSFDMWAVGVIFGQYLLDTKPLFSGHNSREVRKEILETDFDQKFAGVEEPARDLVKKLLHVHQKYRITAEEAIQHPYFYPFYN